MVADLITLKTDEGYLSFKQPYAGMFFIRYRPVIDSCLLYTSDAADDMQCVDLGGRRIIKTTLCQHVFHSLSSSY